jgi:hypothetical protein
VESWFIIHLGIFTSNADDCPHFSARLNCKAGRITSSYPFPLTIEISECTQPFQNMTDL